MVLAVIRTAEVTNAETSAFGTGTVAEGARRGAAGRREVRLKAVGVFGGDGCGFLGGSFFLGSLFCGGAFRYSEARQMGFHLRQAGPADEVELDHLQRSFGRFAAGIQSDQQAGDQGDVQLDGDAVFTVADEMAAAEDAFEPSEKKLDRPAKTVGQRDEIGVEVEAVGDQPKIFDRAVGLGASDDHQPHGTFQDVFVAIGSEPGKDERRGPHQRLARLGRGVVGDRCGRQYCL